MSRPRLANLSSHDARGGRLPTNRITEGQVRRSLVRILGKNTLCSMATVAADRRPHINTAYFCYSAELELYFLSHPRSRHCRNLAVNASMGMAIFSSKQLWAGSDRGLQLFGSCSQARGPQARRAERLYGRRFTGYSRWKAALRPDDVGHEYRLYRFVPRRATILDEREFGGAVFVSATVRRTSPRA